MDRRRECLIEQGDAIRHADSRIFYRRNLLATLEQRDVIRAGTALAASRSLPFRATGDGSECCTGADDIALFECGEQVAAVEDAAIGMTGDVALPDQMLAAAIHGPLHVLPEAGRDQIGGTAPDQSAIEPGRAVRLDLPFQVEG